VGTLATSKQSTKHKNLNSWNYKKMNMPVMTINTSLPRRENLCRLLQPANRQDVYEAQQQEREAALIVDVRGRIIGCSTTAAALLGQTPDTLFNQPVKNVLPNLPFSEGTQGYNLAYAITQGARADWTEHYAQASNGDRFPLKVLLSCRKVSTDFTFELQLRVDATRFQSTAQACAV
jgi:hypothetical protein